MKPSTPIAILASGGMDSFLVWAHYAAVQIPTVNVFVDVGQKYRNKERWAWNHLQRSIPGEGYKGIELKGQHLGHLEHPDTGIIPNRNAHLILAAASVSPIVALGILHGEINSDKSPEFLDAMTHMLNVGNLGQYWNGGIDKKHELRAPLIHYTKSEALHIYLRTGMPAAWALNTISCYSENYGHCGACPSCFKRWVALTNNGLSMIGTGLDFKQDPRIWATSAGVIEKAQDGTYGRRRANEIMSAIALSAESPQ